MNYDYAPAWAVAAVAGIVAMFKWLIGKRVSRVDALEDLVDLLRRKLDESLTRGNAATTMARILLFAVDQEPNPSPAMVAARAHARDVIAAADARLKKRG